MGDILTLLDRVETAFYEKEEETFRLRQEISKQNNNNNNNNNTYNNNNFMEIEEEYVENVGEEKENKIIIDLTKKLNESQGIYEKYLNALNTIEQYKKSYEKMEQKFMSAKKRLVDLGRENEYFKEKLGMIETTSKKEINRLSKNHINEMKQLSKDKENNVNQK